jgi:hypothetical protein
MVLTNDIEEISTVTGQLLAKVCLSRINFFRRKYNCLNGSNELNISASFVNLEASYGG